MSEPKARAAESGEQGERNMCTGMLPAERRTRHRCLPVCDLVGELIGARGCTSDGTGVSDAV
jgi:hypothetical protein